MLKKYLTAEVPTIITNDLFLASFLYTAGCTLARIEKNERRRVSFVFVGERVRELREAYRTGPVHIDMRDFRENLNRLRDRLGETITSHHPEERSASYARARSLNTQQPRVSSFAQC
jgi:hypothetical protein